MGEDSKTKEMTAYIDGQPVDMANISEITLPKASAVGCSEILNPVTASGAVMASISPEQAEAMLKMWADFADAAKATAAVITKAWGEIAHVFALAWELKWATNWAEIHNPRLVRFYRHTKKRRTRKKYEKRILARYREALNHVEN